MLEALIPFFEAPEYTLIERIPLLGDPLKLQVFGPLVMTGVIVGWYQCLRFARTKKMDEWFVRDLMFTILISGFAFAHWVSVIFYFPERIAEDPLVLLKFWNGLSSVGGFFGAWVGMIYFLRKHKQPVMPYADLLMFGLIVGWVFGRSGCSAVHDHPGRVVPEGTFLAVGPWRDGQWRYDLGFLELLYTLALFAYVYFLGKWEQRKPGWVVAVAAVSYAPVRFAMDYFRGDQDVRYAGLTAAQYFCIAFFAAGIWLFMRKPKPSDDSYIREGEYDAGERRVKEPAASSARDDEDAEASAPQDTSVEAEPGDSPVAPQA